MTDPSTVRERQASEEGGQATDADSPSRAERDPAHGALERTVPNLAGAIRKTGFWTAIVVPFLYVPILLNGLTTWIESTTFLVLLGINLLALYVGHTHCQ
ncbi:hypothetical protein EA462_06165 [Natrarchaeobius halalkaliphilus]|uniref:Uncharacterized protein n=1 Tax=Natrarchaeobius halalkaliphilus TaxID=1679091 RepID=A0A3N6M859_9EURY|nr:hypothetical protein [Natrarchaeobius halalkaliphilus]RQG91541.1 hypothetical protein EA462_06165 [Natrarchaeobius halalkaliphilus]